MSDTNDLIRRGDAIDAIFSEPLYKSGMKQRDADEVVPAIYEKIKSLPTAQPYTESEIQKMQDLEQAEIQKAYELGKAEVLADEDAVEVVRCKDCVYQTESWIGIKYCEAHGDHIGKDYDYCSNARRKDNG